MNQHPHIIEALRELGVRFPADFEAIQRAPTFEHAQQMLADLKDHARKNYRKLAFELHPDRTGGDAAQTEHFMRLSRAKQELEAVKLQYRPPRPPPVMRWVNPAAVTRPHPTRPAYTPTGSTSVYTTYYSTASSATSTTTAAGFDPFRVVIMRPF